MPASYSYVTLCIEDWSITEQITRDGEKISIGGYVDGKCPTDICNAVCCRVATYEGIQGKGPCKHLENNLCSLHKARGPAVKPISCVVWPKAQTDIDECNRIAELLGLEGRCQLKIITE